MILIEDLFDRIIDLARQKVHSGAVTERGLARLCNLSQPHLHNVLKNIRALSPASANQLMQGLRVTVPELLWRYPAEIEAGVQAVPIVRGRIGPGAETTLSAHRGYMPLPISLTERLFEPVVARLSPDLVLPHLFISNDLVLLDQNPAVRQAPSPQSCWVVTSAGGLRVRYVRHDGNHLYLSDRTTAESPHKWRSISLRGRKIPDIVKARIVWISRELEETGPSLLL